MGLNTILQVVASIGFVISAYFWLLAGGIIKNVGKLVPEWVCSEKACMKIQESGYAKLFGIPNYYFGIAYYAFLLLTSYLALPWTAFYIILVISWLAMFFSIYLAYSLIIKLRTACTICFVSHAINILVALMLFYRSLSF